MTLEEMQAVAREVVKALKGAGFFDVEYDEGHAPGEPLPIYFSNRDGDFFSLELTAA